MTKDELIKVHYFEENNNKKNSKCHMSRWVKTLTYTSAPTEKYTTKQNKTRMNIAVFYCKANITITIIKWYIVQP